MTIGTTGRMRILPLPPPLQLRRLGMLKAFGIDLDKLTLVDNVTGPGWVEWLQQYRAGYRQQRCDLLRVLSSDLTGNQAGYYRKRWLAFDTLELPS
jgi:hypothetical protein